MGPLFFVVAIMGCGDGNTQCAEARVEPVRYGSLMACQNAMAGALARNTDLSFPVIGASCRSVGQQLVTTSRKDRRG